MGSHIKMLINIRFLTTFLTIGSVWQACLLSTLCGAEAIVDVLEPSTICVARIDLEKLDLPACLQALQEEVPGVLPPQAVGGVQAAVGAAVQGLRGAGARELYVTLSTIELTTGKAVLVVPADNVDRVAEQLRNLIGILPPAMGYSVHQIPGAAVACTDEFWNRRQSKTAFDTSHVMRAIEDQADMHLSINIAVRDSLRQSVADIWPEQLPSSLPVPLSPKQLMSDLRVLQIGLVSPPELRFEAGINCVDATSATRTDTTLQDLLGRVAVSIPKLASRDDRIAMRLDRQQLGELLQRFAPNVQNRTGTAQQSNNLKQLILAIHNFHQAHGGFPPRMTVDAEGKPLLSWRVHLLPYINEADLYKQFHLDEPWFSQHNKQLVEKMPATFRWLTGPELEPGMTCIQAPRMEGSFWNGNENRLLTFMDIPDGTSNTLCFVIAPRDQAVVWTQPEDLQVDPAEVVKSLFGDRDSMQAVFFDSSVQTIGNGFAPEVYRAWLTNKGGEKVERP